MLALDTDVQVYHRRNGFGVVCSIRSLPLAVLHSRHCPIFDAIRYNQSSRLLSFKEEGSEMVWRRRNVFLFALMLTLLCDVAISAKPVNSRRLPGGSWGGSGIQVSVDRNQAAIEYDCAHGTITGPLTLNSRGTFKWRGFYIRERGGPARVDETLARQSVIYAGSVKGSTMTLNVKAADTGTILGTFKLTRGRAGRIFKCL